MSSKRASTLRESRSIQSSSVILLTKPRNAFFLFLSNTFPTLIFSHSHHDSDKSYPDSASLLKDLRIGTRSESWGSLELAIQVGELDSREFSTSEDGIADSGRQSEGCKGRRQRSNGRRALAAMTIGSALSKFSMVDSGFESLSYIRGSRCSAPCSLKFPGK